MSALSEFAQRILAELEELRLENVFGMLNAIVDVTGDFNEVEQLQSALAELVELGFVQMGTEKFAPSSEVVLSKDEGIVLVHDLKNKFMFNQRDRFWTLREGDMLKDRYPIMLATSAGVEEGVRILKERGWGWWHSVATR